MHRFRPAAPLVRRESFHRYRVVSRPSQPPCDTRHEEAPAAYPPGLRFSLRRLRDLLGRGFRLHRLPDADVTRLRHQEEAEHEAHRGHQDRIDQGVAEAARVAAKAADVMNGTKPPPRPLPMWQGTDTDV